MTDLTTVHLPNPIDLHVGARIRLRRRLHGISQGALADALGLSWQQVRKYENGENRVSASKLYKIASALRCPVAYFFDGLPDPCTGEDAASTPSSEHIVHEFLMTGEGLDLARLFPALPQGRVRRRALELMRALTGVADANEEAEG